MNYAIYKMQFSAPVHFGTGVIEKSECSFMADTLFSAMCQEAVASGQDKLDDLVAMTKQGSLLISDAFPYRGQQYFLPKPCLRIRKDVEGNSVVKKAFKNLKYIPMSQFESYLKGDFDVMDPNNRGDFGRSEVRTAVSLRAEDEAMPYRLGIFRFFLDCGLYIIAGFADEEAQRLGEDLLMSVSFAGIGGKRSSGFGRFVLTKEELAPDILKRLEAENGRQMSLSFCLPKEEEMEASLENAEYLLIRRSGFIASAAYADEHQRKRDFYGMKAGSCFAQMFTGDVYDVSNGNGKHPVYRYSKPVFLEVD